MIYLWVFHLFIEAVTALAREGSLQIDCANVKCSFRLFTSMGYIGVGDLLEGKISM
jgi:hypothetical protein